MSTEPQSTPLGTLQGGSHNPAQLTTDDLLAEVDALYAETAHILSHATKALILLPKVATALREAQGRISHLTDGGDRALCRIAELEHQLELALAQTLECPVCRRPVPCTINTPNGHKCEGCLLREVREQIANKDERIAELERDLASAGTVVTRLEQQLAERDQRITALEKLLGPEKQAEIDSAIADAINVVTELCEIAVTRAETAERKLAERDQRIAELERQLAEAQKHAGQMVEAQAYRAETIRGLEKQIEERDQRIVGLEKALEESAQRSMKIAEESGVKSRRIAELERDLANARAAYRRESEAEAVEQKRRIGAEAELETAHEEIDRLRQRMKENPNG